MSTDFRIFSHYKPLKQSNQHNGYTFRVDAINYLNFTIKLFQTLFQKITSYTLNIKRILILNELLKHKIKIKHKLNFKNTYNVDNGLQK